MVAVHAGLNAGQHSSTTTAIISITAVPTTAVTSICLTGTVTLVKVAVLLVTKTFYMSVFATIVAWATKLGLLGITTLLVVCLCLAKDYRSLHRPSSRHTSVRLLCRAVPSL